MSPSTKDPFISIVIPAKNEANLLPKCLNGIYDLDYPKDLYEVIVVDNGSTDNTEEVVGQYKEVIFISTEGNIGHVRNIGGKKSKGEYIAFIDADCIPSKNWLSESLTLINSNVEIDVVSATLASGESTSTPPWVEFFWVNYINSKNKNAVSTVETISSFCFVIKRKVMESVDWFNPDLETCEDSDLGYRINQSGGKLVISKSISANHLRNAKTIAEFFYRQKWQGKSNIKNFLSHSLVLSELPSIFLPYAYVALIILLPITALFSSFYPMTILSLLVVIPSMIGLRTLQRTKGPWYQFFGYVLIWGAYLTARGLAITFPFGNSWSR